jgi:hypothetical protein
MSTDRRDVRNAAKPRLTALADSGKQKRFLALENGARGKNSLCPSMLSF